MLSGNCQTASIQMREEKAGMDLLHDKYIEEAEAEEEAARLEIEGLDLSYSES